MKRLFTGVMIALVVVLAFLLRIKNVFFFDIFIGVLSIFASYEVAKILKKSGKRNEVSLSILFPALAYILVIFEINTFKLDIGKIFISIILLFIAIFVLIFGYYLVTKNKILELKEEDDYKGNIYKYMFKCAMDSIFSFIYPTFFIMCIIILNHLNVFDALTKISAFDGAILDIGLIAIMFMIITTCVTDIFGLYVGSLIRGKKLAPSISPNKTISGAIGGLVGSVLFSIITYLVFINISGLNSCFNLVGLNVVFVIIYGLFASIISQIGDLFESYLKRKAKVKDSGNILPGHGGIMDRIDGLCFNAIFTLLMFIILLI